MKNICTITDSMYGGYYGELIQYDGYHMNAYLGGYHADTIKKLKETVKKAWETAEIEFVRVK